MMVASASRTLAHQVEGWKRSKGGDAAAGHQHHHAGAGHGVHVVHGQGRYQAVPARLQFAQPAQAPIPFPAPKKVLIRQHTALGLPVVPEVYSRAHSVSAAAAG